MRRVLHINTEYVSKSVSECVNVLNKSYVIILTLISGDMFVDGLSPLCLFCKSLIVY